MKILINYADKQYEPARKWNTLTGRYIARFDKVYEYTPNDIVNHLPNYITTSYHKKEETACGFGNLIL